MKHEDYSLSGLYYHYKHVDDDKIRKYLERIQLVQHKGDIGYFPLTQAALKKIKAKPRNISLTFDAASTTKKPVYGLKPWKNIVFLVKSTSRFFLKPDIGEVFDQIPWQDLLDNKIKAICVNLKNHETLPDTQGEHFLMEAELLIDKKEE